MLALLVKGLLKSGAAPMLGVLASVVICVLRLDVLPAVAAGSTFTVSWRWQAAERTTGAA